MTDSAGIMEPSARRKVIVYYMEFGDQGQIEPDHEYSLQSQKNAVAAFIAREHCEVVLELIEPFEKKRKAFPYLKKALTQCKQLGAKLIIVNLSNFARFDGFVNPLLQSKVEFACLDQPKTTHETLPAIVEHYALMSSLHSQRIRVGLSQTMKQLGNPHAKQEITKVNRPKTESAIMFAVILSPITDLYRRQGFSQRKMVDALNEDGFLAPEGGQWVLSQLQKVLDRIDLNNISLNLSSYLDEFDEKNYAVDQQVRALKAMEASVPGRGEWDEEKLKKIRERRDLIRDIMSFNSFIAEVYPQMKQYADDGMDDAHIANLFNEEGIRIPERILWEIEQNSAGIQGQSKEEKALSWTAEDVEIFRNLSLRRADDMENFIHPETYRVSMDLLVSRFQRTDSVEQQRDFR